MPRNYPTTRMCSGEILTRFEPTVRDSDVFVVTSAKCGQTWLCTLLYHLKTKGLSPDMEDKSLLGVVPWLEIPYDIGTHEGGQEIVPYNVDDRLALFESMESPRVFKMHVVYNEVPRPPNSKAKIIVISRDPRDVPYSMYMHLSMQAKPAHPLFRDGKPTFEEFFERWLANEYYSKHFRSIWPHRDDEDVLLLRYEDMKRDVHTYANRIVSFLGWNHLTQDEIDRAVELADFRNMQKMEKKVLFRDMKNFRQDLFFIREGAVGKNRAKLSEEMTEQLCAKLRDVLQPDAYEWIFSDNLDIPESKCILRKTGTKSKCVEEEPLATVQNGN